MERLIYAALFDNCGWSTTSPAAPFRIYTQELRSTIKNIQEKKSLSANNFYQFFLGCPASTDKTDVLAILPTNCSNLTDSPFFAVSVKLRPKLQILLLCTISVKFDTIGEGNILMFILCRNKYLSRSPCALSFFTLYIHTICLPTSVLVFKTYLRYAGYYGRFLLSAMFISMFYFQCSLPPFLFYFYKFYSVVFISC